MKRLLAWTLLSVLLSSCALAEGAQAPAFSCRDHAGVDPAGQTIETTLAGVPAIVRVPRRIERPPIVLWHGFGSPASERALADALPLEMPGDCSSHSSPAWRIHGSKPRRSKMCAN